jgi:predicted dehydrogenase
MLFDLRSHLIDQVVVLFGTPITVNCTLFDEADGKNIKEERFVDDGFLILLGYGNGLNGKSLSQGWTNMSLTQAVELHSTQYSVSTQQKRFEILGQKGR